jgi:hypothetical protein
MGLRAGHLGVALALLLSCRVARADGEDAAVQFNYGLSEMTAGRYTTGCPALEASFRLDPRPGTLFTLAECNRQWGKLASALAGYEEYLAQYERMSPEQKAKQADRVRVALAERKTLKESVPHLTVRLPEGAPPGTVASRDDVELGGPMLGAAVAVDPGEHVVRVRTPDGQVREQRLTLTAGEDRIVTVELPVAAAPVVGPPPTMAPAGPTQVPSHPDAAPTPASAPSHRVWTLAAGAIGGAGLVVAGVAGIIVLAKKPDVTANCNAQGVCASQADANAGNAAHGIADVGTAALVVGGVGLAAALVLWLTEPRAPVAAGSAARLVWSPVGIGVGW